MLKSQTLATEFVDEGYSLLDLSSVPGVPGPYGGLTIKPEEPNTLYIGGAANQAGGALYSIGLERDAQTNSIIGYAGTATLVVATPNIDGGATFAPNGTFLFTRYNMNNLGQILPDDTYTTVSLTQYGISSSVGGLALVPTGFSAAGNLILASYNGSALFNVPYTISVDGEYLLSNQTESVSVAGVATGPEGIAYIPENSAGFPNPSMAISAYSLGKVVVFDVDSDGLPIPATARDMITGLSGAEGAMIDPVTGDFLFATFGGGNRVIVISGFAPPTDCAGVFFGESILDECGVCLLPDDPDFNATCTDCAGEVNGPHEIDECNVCIDGGPSNPDWNTNCQDCAGTPNGEAYFDECSVCVGGNTGLDPCVQDCHGDFGGQAYLDNCGICVGGNTGIGPCVDDCNGDPGGTAFIDDCTVCVGGNTGLEACVEDCEGEFGGDALPGTECIDLAGAVGVLNGNCECVVSIVPGCTDPGAANYNPEATEDDGSCEYDCTANGGIIATDDETTLCIDSNATVEVYFTSPVNDDYTIVWVITDDAVNPLILDIFMMQPTDGFGFDGYAGFDFNIWAVNVDAPNGIIDALLADIANGMNPNISDLEGLCWAASNPIPVTLEVCDEPVFGCTDMDALNYNPNATVDDGSCIFPICDVLPVEIHSFGNTTICADSLTQIEFQYESNSNPVYFFTWIITDQSDDPIIVGMNYETPVGGFVFDNYIGTEFQVWFLNSMDPNLPTSILTALMNGIYHPLSYFEDDCFALSNPIAVTLLDCGQPISGCTDPDAINYLPLATEDDGSCEYDIEVPGCTDPEANNYNPEATEEDGSCEYAEGCFAESVLDYVEGIQLNGDPIWADRVDPNAALGEPDRVNAEGGFVSLGYGGSISLGFSGQVVDQPGDDILVWETSFGQDGCNGGGNESAHVELSQDGVTWVAAGTLCRDGAVDIAVTGLPWIAYIKIINDAVSTTFDGYDVDGVEAINGCQPFPVEDDCYGSEVLAYNPGPRYDGSPITDPERLDPTKALGPPQLDDSFNFVSLGYGGDLVIGFEGFVVNGPGADILVAETTFGPLDFTNYPESADVYVSQDGTNFYFVGSMTTNQIGLFDITAAGQGFAWITSVKVVDTTPDGSVSDDGFDVDAIVAINGCDPDLTDIPGECYASQVLEYVQGTTSGGGAIAANRTDPTQALGEPEGTDELVFVALGYDGSLTLGFDGSVPNGPGADLEIVETTYNFSTCANYPEYADVYVSQNNMDFFFAGTICRDDNFIDIDDAGQGFVHINQVKIVNNNLLTTSPDGFDVDGVRAIHNCEEDDNDVPTPTTVLSTLR